VFCVSQVGSCVVTCAPYFLKYVDLFVNLYAYSLLNICICRYTSVCIYLCMHLYMHDWYNIYMHMYICIYSFQYRAVSRSNTSHAPFTYGLIYTCRHIYVDMNVYIYLYIYAYIFNKGLFNKGLHIAVNMYRVAKRHRMPYL